jgi:hypothetical protein
VRGKENLLRCVLRLDGIAKKQTAEPEHHPAVTGEQLADEDAGRSRIRTAG